MGTEMLRSSQAEAKADGLPGYHRDRRIGRNR
jgi:hypothetical protein